ncbi:UNVERIFIED_CONTAM: Retrovirus-related Pol polyprotein from transposon TNT 1-94 [Sesamum angustifolium]|uniref:Retrovirus-related Pol polyprotein from transposon TNT 1-94 n=1 Tax=Sesamum angustifolium TaxID=2727405 RepID=A0AAW2J469_9LAMI
MGVSRRRVTLPEDSSTSSSAEKGKLENKKAKDSEALYYIQTAGRSFFPRISVATSAKEAWRQKEYQGSAKVRIIKLQTLRRDFENMKMKDSETIDEYYTKVRELVNQLKAYGEDIPEKRPKQGKLHGILSAASNHMTYNKGAFQTLDESFKTNVKLGDKPHRESRRKRISRYQQKKTYHKSKLSRELAKPVYKENNTRSHSLQEPPGRAKAVLELIHTDVCGPMRTPSHEQNRYFILFIDDYSRMTWFSEAIEEKEYNNSEFDKFCEEEGIEHQTTVSYNPQQNGVSERKNRTVMEMARSMLQEKHLPKAFWAEAVYTAVYLLNRICYVHIPTEKRHKLEEKTEKGIFLGYSTQSKGYRIFNLKTKKLIISRDVEFDEDAMWNWDEEKVERQSVMIPKETPPQQQQEEGTDQAEMERRSQQAPGSPRRPPSSEEIEEETPPRRTKLLSDIYETCNFIMLEQRILKLL